MSETDPSRWTLDTKRDGLDYIFSNFSALTTGFARAIASLPTALKSKLQPCCSGYLWVPQKVVPHRHLNPVNPTRLLQTEHRLGWAVVAGACASGVNRSAAAVPRLQWSPVISARISEGRARATIDEEEAAERDFSTADLAEEACSSFRWKSL